MKIILKEDEVYEIKIPEQISATNFISLVDRLHKIIKLVNIDVTGLQKDFKPRTYKPRAYGRGKKCPLYDTREKVLDLLQYGYHGTKEDKKRISELMNLKWEEIQKRFHALVKRHNIQPNEIGLLRFKRQTDSPLINRKITDWEIKSHTGVFDENGNN